MTVAELIEKLQTFPPDTPVAVRDSYGDADHDIWVVLGDDSQHPDSLMLF